ncbi:MAG: site-specific integrase [Gammaproteobacteria bacterium]|nr:site-specific integrase [Gammaproteobacteria bacterium]
MTTFADFVASPWTPACHEPCKPSTRRRVESLLRTQLLPEFGAMCLARLGHENIRIWFDRYSRVAPAGANRALDVLSQILNFAIECGQLTSNPARAIRRNPQFRKTRFLTRTEIERLHRALDDHRGRGSGVQQADIIRLLLLTGCRKGELINLRWAEVGDDRLVLTDSKTGPRAVFLSAAAKAILDRQPRIGEYVFPSSADPSTCRSPELSLWRKVRHAASIDDVRLHDLRHTFASHAVMAGVPLPVVSRLLGHSQMRMTLRYAHVSDRETEAAAERIGSAMSATLAGAVPAPMVDANRPFAETSHSEAHGFP